MTTQGIDDHARSSAEFSNPVIRWIDYRLPIFTFLRHELHDYPAPRNLNYLWNFGSLAGIVLLIMIATGIVLAMNYHADGRRCFQLRRAHHARRELRLADPICAYQRRIDVFRRRSTSTSFAGFTTGPTRRRANCSG